MDRHIVTRFLRCLMIVGLLWCGALVAQPIDREMYANVVRSNSKHNCPFFEEGVNIEKLSYTPGRLHFHITAKEQVLMGLGIPELKKFYADRLRYRLEHEYFNYLYSHLGDINGGLSYHFTLADSDSSFTIAYSPQEVRQIWSDRSKPAYKNAKRWKARRFLQRNVFIANAQIRAFLQTSPPQEPPSYLLPDSLAMTEDWIVYYMHPVDDSSFRLYVENQEVVLSNNRDALLADPDRLDQMIDAECGFRYQVFNQLRTDSLIMDFPLTLLKEWRSQAKKLTLANDSQMREYMELAAEEMMESFEEAMDSASNMKMESAEYNDGIFLLVYAVQENTMNFNMTAKEQNIVKAKLASVMKTIIEDSYSTPEVFDSIMITKELFCQYFKGLRILYMEENTRRAIDLFVSAQEINNAEKIGESVESLSSEKIASQLSSELFAQAIEQYSRENFPQGDGKASVERMSFEDGVLNIYNVVDTLGPVFFNIDLLREQMKLNLAEQISGVQDDNIFRNLLALNGAIAYHFHIRSVDTVLTVAFSSEELKRMQEAANADGGTAVGSALEGIIRVTNLQCPVVVDEITTLDSVGVDGQNFVYYFSVSNSNSYYDANVLRAMLRMNLMNEGDAAMEYLKSLCVKSGFGICYHYVFPKEDLTARKKAKRQSQAPTEVICFTVEEIQ